MRLCEESIKKQTVIESTEQYYATRFYIIPGDVYVTEDSKAWHAEGVTDLVTGRVGEEVGYRDDTHFKLQKCSEKSSNDLRIICTYNEKNVRTICLFFQSLQ